LITIDQGNGYRPSDDDSDLEIDSNVYFGSGNNNDKQGRNTKKKLLDEYTQKHDERVAEKNHHLSKNGQLRVFRDSNTKDDQVGHQVYDLVEKANADFKKAEEEKRDKMRLEQRRELEKQTAIAREFALFAEQGEVFYKYGRQGFPRARRLTVILMKDHKTVEARWGPGNSFIQLRKHDAVLLDGKQTKVFRRKVAKKAQNSLCFSLANSSRTLDVEARSQIIKDKWFRGLKLLVLSLHHS
jgi:hypothetical protein